MIDLKIIILYNEIYFLETIVRGAVMKTKQFAKDYTFAVKACEIFDENKAENVMLIDVSYLSNIADYFVIATANSTTHAKALVDKIEEALEGMGQKVYRRDGLGDGRWLVLDFGSLIVHIFTAEIREFYHIEKLWSDGKNALNMVGIRKMLEQADKAEKQTEVKAKAKKVESKPVAEPAKEE